MDTKVLSGDVLSKAIREEVRSSVEELRAKGVLPRLAAVLTDSNPTVVSYAESKAKMAANLGIVFDLVVLPEGETQEKLETKLIELGDDSSMHGIMLELPLAPNFDLGRALDRIPPRKDVDGLTAINIGLAYMNREEDALVAATPQACIMLAETALKEEGKSLAGARVGMVGKGRTVGRSLIAMLLNRHATVTVCHSQTTDLAASLRDCDVIFSGVGKPGLLNRDNLREGQMLIDAGMIVVDGKLRGDVDFESVRGFIRAATPVPQGVGPVTTALVFKNLIRAIQFQLKT